MEKEKSAMNKLQSNNLNVIVNIQYGIGFELVEGNVEIEITIFNKTQRSQIVLAGRNRISFNEEFIWGIDKTKLKYYRSTNELVKIECFTTPAIVYGNICRRQRLGLMVIKLKEFQIIGRDWIQIISPRSYKFQGSSSYYELRMILIIQEDLENLGKSKNIKKKLGTNDKDTDFSFQSETLERCKQSSTRDKNIAMSREYMNTCQLRDLKYDRTNQINEQSVDQFENVLDKQAKYRKTIDECDELLSNLNSKDNKHEKSRKHGTHNELSIKKKKGEISSVASKESLKTNNYYECRIRELLTTCFKYTEEEWLKIMKKIKKELDTNDSKLYSSGSSIQSENDLERPIIMVKGIKKKLNDLQQYMVNENEKIKRLKIKRSREVSNLKATNLMFSELCDTFEKKINYGV